MENSEFLFVGGPQNGRRVKMPRIARFVMPDNFPGPSTPNHAYTLRPVLVGAMLIEVFFSETIPLNDCVAVLLAGFGVASN